jgi:hypothetical protein
MVQLLVSKSPLVQAQFHAQQVTRLLLPLSHLVRHYLQYVQSALQALMQQLALHLVVYVLQVHTLQMAPRHAFLAKLESTLVTAPLLVQLADLVLILDLVHRCAYLALQVDMEPVQRINAQVHAQLVDMEPEPMINALMHVLLVPFL